MTDERIRILVVDDDPEILDTLREYLEDLEDRYVIETAARGIEALEMVARARPHLVLLDVEMPGMNGVQVLKSLRTVDPTIPVIMLTATTDASVAAEAFEAGGGLLRSQAFGLSVSRSPYSDVRDEAPGAARLVRLG